MRGVVVGLHRKHAPGGIGMPKLPVDAVRVRAAGVEGDHNEYRQKKLAGDPDSAVLVMADEVLDALRAEGWPVARGSLGENVTTRGVPYDAMTPGATLALGSVRLQVSRACEPCRSLWKLDGIGDARGAAFVKALVGRRGWYCRVLAEGEVRVGDAVEAAAPPR